MKRITLLISITILFAFSISSVFASTPQKKKKRITNTAPSSVSKTASANNNIQVRVRFANGREVAGRLIDISLKNISLDPGNGSVVVATLQEVTNITVSAGGVEIKRADPEFLKDADNAYKALLALSLATDNNISYSEYQPKINEAKLAVESFISKHEREGHEEVVRAMRSAIKGFELVQPVWSLRVGAEQHKYVLTTDEQMRPIIQMFPEIEQVAWKTNNRYPIEKVIAWVWVQTGRIVEQSKQQIAKLR